ncbi:MAG TPA: hypothetical protein VFF73_29800 [Planctomycetota bacterium]|nr:hypothetical protein [Planctomycetota bacterium]
MSDEKLRRLERRWRETGSAADEAAWLRERARTGDLEPERLHLAAYLGHEPARVAVPQALGGFAHRLGKLGGPFKDAMTPFGCYEHPPSGILAEWSTLLPEESMEVCVRLSVATSRAALLACSDPAFQTWGNEVIAAIETWLNGPRTPESLRILAGYWWSHTRNGPRSADPSADAIGFAIMSAQVLSSYDPEGIPDAPDDEDEFEEFCKERAEQQRPAVIDVFAGAQHALGVERTSVIETMVREDLVPWLLGNGDPVAERVRARIGGEDRGSGAGRGRSSRG